MPYWPPARLFAARSRLRLRSLSIPTGPERSSGIDPASTVDRDGVLFNVTVPDYYVFLPERERAVVVCPGGGYGCVCYEREGLEVARWLGDHGIAALVLRYRMPNGHHEIPLEDVHEAIRIARRNAPSWGVDPHQVGVMGFSAGGHLASTASTHFDERTRPDFSILIYPVITMGERYTHMGSRENLLGKGYDAGLVERYSSERQVTPQTPPAFIALSDNDEVVPVRNSILYYDALKENGVPAELHVYPTGRHRLDRPLRLLGRVSRGLASLARPSPGGEADRVVRTAIGRVNSAMARIRPDRLKTRRRGRFGGSVPCERCTERRIGVAIFAQICDYCVPVRGRKRFLRGEVRPEHGP